MIWLGMFIFFFLRFQLAIRGGNEFPNLVPLSLSIIGLNNNLKITVLVRKPFGCNGAILYLLSAYNICFLISVFYC